MSRAGSNVPKVSVAVSRCAHLLMALITLPVCTASARTPVEPLEIYRQGMQSMLDTVIVPTLKGILTLTERAQLGNFHIEVTGSNDPQQMWAPDSRSGAVSA